MNSNFRRQILQILAQQTVPAPTATTAGPATITGTPHDFDPYAYYPTMMIGFDAKNVPLIRQLSNILNWSLYVLTNGDVELNKLRASNFVFDVSKYSDRIMITLIKFALQVYRLIYTNMGAPFKTTITNRDQRIQMLKNALTNLPDGSINAYLSTKIGGNPKIILLNILSQIK